MAVVVQEAIHNLELLVDQVVVEMVLVEMELLTQVAVVVQEEDLLQVAVEQVALV